MKRQATEGSVSQDATERNEWAIPWQFHGPRRVDAITYSRGEPLHQAAYQARIAIHCALLTGSRLGRRLLIMIGSRIADRVRFYFSILRSNLGYCVLYWAARRTLAKGRGMEEGSRNRQGTESRSCGSTILAVLEDETKWGRDLPRFCASRPYGALVPGLRQGAGARRPGRQTGAGTPAISSSGGPRRNRTRRRQYGLDRCPGVATSTNSAHRPPSLGSSLIRKIAGIRLISPPSSPYLGENKWTLFLCMTACVLQPT